MEKRSSSRKDVMREAQVLIDNSLLTCMVQNISSAGALVRIDEDLLADHTIETGIEITIVFETDEPGITGKIIRKLHDGGYLFFAVYFYKKFDIE